MPDDEGKDGLGELVLPLVLQVNGGLPRVIGSCVVIAVAKRRAVAFTARHVIEFMFDMVDMNRLKELKVAPYFQKVRFGESFSDGAGKVTLSDSLKLSAVRMPDSAVARVTGISYFPGRDLDIATVALELENDQDENFTVRCPMASQGAFLGDSVILCGHPKGDITSYQRGSGKAQLTIAKSWKTGSVVGHLGWGEDYFVRSPGLLVDTGCPPGYSGGPVLIQSALLESPVLVGIISSSDEYQTKASMIWPALPLNHMMKHDGSVPNSVLGLFSIKDAITDVSNGASHIMINASALTLKDHVTWND